MYRDLVLATRLGQHIGAPLTAGNHARELFHSALEELGDNVYITQLNRIFEQTAGVDVCEVVGEE